MTESELPEYSLIDFVGMLAETLEHDEIRVVPFLGAGASRSSHIPTAGELVRHHWLPRDRSRRGYTGAEPPIDEWGQERFSGYDPENPAGIYGELIEHLFVSPAQRQTEIEKIVAKGSPNVGYGILARMMAHPIYGRRLGTVLTTNFDDMIDDALFIHTRMRSRVIGHHSLGALIQTTRERPQIIKLHGDAHLEPLNTDDETGALPQSLISPTQKLLQECMLIFVGYGGSDQTIVQLLQQLPTTPSGGVWWINDRAPSHELHQWLLRVDARWVNHRDFDELMVMLAHRCELDMTMPDHFEEERQRFSDAYADFLERLESTPEPDSAASDKIAAADEVVRRLGPGVDEARNAWALRTKDPEAAQVAFKRAYEENPRNPIVLRLYAEFLNRYLHDHKRAQAMYENAIAADPESAGLLGNYAVFLDDSMGDHEKARDMYERAIAADPGHANNLGNFATFLYECGEYDRAQELYERAISSDPAHANALGNYANFLTDACKEHDRAEQLYEQSIEANPHDANILGNFAAFLHEIRQDYNRAEELYKRALEINPNHVAHLGNYAEFLAKVRDDRNRAKHMLNRAFELDPDNDATHQIYTELFPTGSDSRDGTDSA